MDNLTKSIGKISDIQVYDNFLDVDSFISLYSYICNKNTWVYGAKSSDDDSDYYDQVSGISKMESTMFWRMMLTDDKYFSEYLFDKVKQITDKDWDIEMIYANGTTFGQGGDFHIDHENGYTFLIYNNIHWDVSWAGKTIFHDEDNNIHYMNPIPNRAILFPGTILHCSESPSRKFRGLRITTAFKLFPKQES
jgi:hypothetical protein